MIHGDACLEKDISEAARARDCVEQPGRSLWRGGAWWPGAGFVKSCQVDGLGGRQQIARRVWEATCSLP